MSCDIVIPVFNKPGLTKNCIESISSNTGASFGLIVIDNASSDGTAGYLEGLKSRKIGIYIIRNESNLGWVKAVNQGIAIAKSPYVCIMNNDTVVRTGGWLEKLMGIAESNEDIGLVNPRFDSREDMAGAPPFTEVDFCRGYCVLIKRCVIDRIGSLDESYGHGYYDDDDYSVRAIRAGYLCVRANHVVVEHLRDSTFKDVFEEKKRIALHEKNKRLFYSKWGRRLRLVFIVNGCADRDRTRDILLTAARRQHIVYLWNSTESFNINHINVRERRLSKPLLCLELAMNRFKSPDKRYDAVFRGDIDERIIEKIDLLAERKHRCSN